MDYWHAGFLSNCSSSRSHSAAMQTASARSCGRSMQRSDEHERSTLCQSTMLPSFSRSTKMRRPGPSFSAAISACSRRSSCRAGCKADCETSSSPNAGRCAWLGATSCGTMRRGAGRPAAMARLAKFTSKGLLSLLSTATPVRSLHNFACCGNSVRCLNVKCGVSTESRQKVHSHFKGIGPQSSR